MVSCQNPTVLYRTVLYRTVPYCTVLYCTVAEPQLPFLWYKKSNAGFFSVLFDSCFAFSMYNNLRQRVGGGREVFWHQQHIRVRLSVLPDWPEGLALLEGTVSLSQIAAIGLFMGYDTGPDDNKGRAGRWVYGVMERIRW